jgi:hypothetical protein
MVVTGATARENEQKAGAPARHLKPRKLRRPVRVISYGTIAPGAIARARGVGCYSRLVTRSARPFSPPRRNLSASDRGLFLAARAQTWSRVAKNICRLTSRPSAAKSGQLSGTIVGTIFDNLGTIVGTSGVPTSCGFSIAVSVPRCIGPQQFRSRIENGS